jgi:phage terminase large subunit GpA-like protein
MAASKYGVVERIRDDARQRLGDAVRGALARAYSPPPKLTVSEWADRYRFLPSESAAEPGKWDTARVEPARGVMDAFSDPLVEKVTVMSSAQLLKTEALLNVIGYYAHGDPAPILVLQPSVDMAEAFSKDRMSPSIRDTPVLKRIFNDKGNASSETILLKSFPGGRVTMVGANAPAGLASRPIRVVLADEVDRYPVSAGREGDPVGLASERTETFWNRKIGLFSTPTIKGESRIEASFLEGDQRRYHLTCPHCDHAQHLVWSQVKWGPEVGLAPEDAAYFCEGCGSQWSEAERLEAIKGGRWIATEPFKGHASFHINRLASPWTTIGKIVKKFLESKGHPELLKQFINTVLGETWEEGGERADPDSLYGRREVYEAGYVDAYGPDAPKGVLPAAVGLITAGVDIQGNRFECEIVGWGAHEERHSLDYIVHFADPTAPAFWAALDDVIRRQFQHPSGVRMKIAITCIDSGFMTQAVHDYCRPRYGWGVRAIKGIQGPGRSIWPKKATTNQAKNTDTFIVGVDTAKNSMQQRLMIRERGPGFCHFPKRYPYETAYFEQLTVEKAITKYKNGHAFKVWEKADNARNEAWDCCVYSYAAFFSAGVDVGRRLAELNASLEAKKASLEPVKIAAPGGPARRVRNSGISA